MKSHTKKERNLFFLLEIKEQVDEMRRERMDEEA
jgi:hypothetical protein